MEQAPQRASECEFIIKKDIIRSYGKHPYSLAAFSVSLTHACGYSSPDTYSSGDSGTRAAPKTAGGGKVAGDARRGEARAGDAAAGADPAVGEGRCPGWVPGPGRGRADDKSPVYPLRPGAG